MDNLQLYKQQLLKKYIEKNITASERHELEKLALDDAFLFESMEGYSSSKQKKQIRHIVVKQTPTKKVFPLNKILAVAAGLILLAASIFLLRPKMSQSAESSREFKEESSVQTYADVPQTETEPENEMGFNVDKNQEQHSIPTSQENEVEENIKQVGSYELKKQNQELKQKSQATKSEATRSPNLTVPISKPIEEKESVVFEKEEQTPVIANAEPEKRLQTFDGIAIESNEIVVEDESTEVDQLDQAVESTEQLKSKANLEKRRSRDLKEESFEADSESRFLNEIKGVIQDESGNPLIGANVLVQDTDQGTLADLDGSFKLANVHLDSELVISYTGFSTQTIPVKSLKEKNTITLEAGALLSEVVVTGGNNQANKLQALPVMGESSYQDYIKEAVAQIENCSGSVRLEFEIDHDGILRHFKVLDSLNESCDQAAIGILMNGGAWMTVPPRKQITYTYTISF